jgi:hypothetical protein
MRSLAAGRLLNRYKVGLRHTNQMRAGSFVSMCRNPFREGKSEMRKVMKPGVNWILAPEAGFISFRQAQALALWDTSASAPFHVLSTLCN